MKKIILIIVVAIIVVLGIVGYFILKYPVQLGPKPIIENTSAQSSPSSQTSSKYQSSLSVASSSSEKKSASSKSSYYSSTSSEKVKIINPNKGQIFHAGDTVNVEVRVSNEKARVLIATSLRESVLIEKAPYNLEFVIPNEKIGPLSIFAGATDVAGGYIGSDKVTINVSVTSNLTDIKVYPEDSPVYLTVGSALPLSVYGLYDDNIEREITSSGLISYTSSNLDVAEVSAEGLITAKSKGEAVITIEHLGIKKEITIIGEAEPDIRFSPYPYDFGNVSAGGHSETKKFTVKNMGYADLVIGILSIERADISMFRIQNDNCSGRTVTASEECTVDIVFTPTLEGARSAYLSIPSNDPNTKNLIMRLTGTGTL